MADLDALVESVGRWTAGRTTRRGFLGRVGRAAVLVAGGPAMAVLLAEQAEARVCGQSGVAPKCGTFDCDAIWGWCWYASGCCADGALKKICDCCAPNTPHPVGYCPSGTRVLCIVESCGADPRLQTRTITRLRDTAPTALSVAASQTRYPGTAAVAVLGDAESSLAAAAAVALGRVVDGPVLLSLRLAVPEAVLEELDRLAVEHVVVAGAALSGAVDAALLARGRRVHRVGGATEVGAFTAEVAEWSRRLTGARAGVVITPSAGEAAAGPAAMLAGARALPLYYGDAASLRRAVRAPRRLTVTYVFTADPAQADGFDGAVPVVADSPAGFASAAADLAVGQGVERALIGLYPAGDHRAAVALAALRGPLLGCVPGSLDGARDWLFAHRPGIQAALVAGTEAQFGDGPYYELQSILNEYETHLLRGRGGEGLPVIPQPRDERPVGKARR